MKVTCATAGVQLRYTTDGALPSPGSASVDSGGTIPLQPGTTLLRIRAFADGMAPSVAKGGLYLVGKALRNGLNHSFALTTDATVRAWGLSDNGQLGFGDRKDAYVPGELEDMDGFLDVAGGEFHSVGLKSDSTVWCWGNNDYGQLGMGPRSIVWSQCKSPA